MVSVPPRYRRGGTGIALTNEETYMLNLKTKKELSQDAHTLARGQQMVRYRGVTYVPADFETLETDQIPDDERKIWLPLNRQQIQRMAADTFDTLFGSDSELSSFDFMVAQNARAVDHTVSQLLVRTPDGLRELDETGQLVEVSGEFRPNTLAPMLNTKQKDKDRIAAIISEWVGGDEEAESLLRHLATSLAPGWSAVKYVLLLGEGRNGKSLLLKMLQSLFGKDNVSHVTRQKIAESNPAVLDLNGKLLNIVFDGQAEYVKDSGNEKSLTAGEPVAIRRLYESTATPVQTTALFLEGLNHEPKTKDKSVALQKRLVRFQFPNVYDEDKKFEKVMLHETALGAFLSLLIDHYVMEDDVAVALRPTARSIELQLEQMYTNSIGLQYLKHLEETDALGSAGLLGKPLADVVPGFQSWRVKENDLGSWSDPDVQSLFAPLFNSERKSVRVDGKVRKVRVITSFKTETLAFIKSLEGNPDDAILEALVED